MNRKPLMSKTQNICLIILCLLFILLTVVMIKELLEKRKSKEPSYNSLDTTSEVVTNAISNWQFDLCGEMAEFVKKIYNGNFNPKSMSTTEQLYMVLIDPKIKKITLKEINAKLNSMMVSNTLTSENIIEIIDKNIFKNSFDLKYTNETLSINKISSSICNSKEQILININKAEENGKYLNIYINIAYGIESVNDENNEVVDYYKDIEAKNMVERLSKNNNNIPSWEEYNIFKYKFLIEDNNYKLESVTLENNT